MQNKRWAMPSSYTILLGLTVLVVGLTWIIPGGQYISEEGIQVYKSAGIHPKGLWNIFSATISGFFESLDVVVFVLSLGGLFGIILRTGALERGIAALIQRLSGREEYLIPVLMLLFGLGGSVFGMAEETIAFYVIVIVAFLRAGYDVVVPFQVVFLGAGVGVLASTVNPFATGIASNIAGIPLLEGSLARIALFIILEFFVIVWTMRYAARVKKDKSLSLVADLHQQHVNKFLDTKDSHKKGSSSLSSKDKIVLALMGFTFLILIVSLIPWEELGIPLFVHIFEWLKPITILGFAYPETYGAALPFGQWYFQQLSVWFFIMALVIAWVARFKEEETVKYFIDGMRDLFGVAVVISVARGIKVIMDSSGLSATLLFHASEALQQLHGFFFINLAHIFFLPLSFLIPSTSGLATVSMPILAPISEAVGVGAASLVTAFQSAEGIINLVTPTSGIVMGGLAIAGIPYNRWLIQLWKPLLMIFIISSVIITIDTYLRSSF